MGFRFSRRIKIAPGITLNLSKSGVSTSIGVPGARVTYGHGKKRTTVGIPGTGLSATEIEKLADRGADDGAHYSFATFAFWIAVVLALLWLFS